MTGRARPAEEVHNFLGRPGPRRGARTLADHLNPAPAPAPARREPTPVVRAAARPPAPQPRPAPTPVVPAPVVPAPPVVRQPEPAVVGAARRSERVVELDDDQPVVTVPARERTGATLRLTLQWERPVTSSGLLRSTDIHLGCLWETCDRHSGVVQSLGERLMAPGFGARQVLRLGPRSEEGEEILADGKHLDILRRVYLYAYGRSGPPDFAVLRPRLSITSRDNGRLVLGSEPPGPGSPGPGARSRDDGPPRIVLLASLHDVQGDLIIRRENTFLASTARLAADYGFADLPWLPDGATPRST